MNVRRTNNFVRRYFRRLGVTRLTRKQTRTLLALLIALAPASYGLSGQPISYVGNVDGHPGCYEVIGTGEFLLLCADGFWGP